MEILKGDYEKLQQAIKDMEMPFLSVSDFMDQQIKSLLEKYVEWTVQREAYEEENRKAEIYIRLILLFGVCMPYYILLSNLTDDGWKTVRERPERIKEVNKELEAFGVRVIRQYAVLGPYDFVNIVEAPDNETIAKVSIELGFRGTIKILSLPAIPIDEFIASVKKN